RRAGPAGAADCRGYRRTPRGAAAPGWPGSGGRRAGYSGWLPAFFDPLLGRRALADPLRILPPGSVAPARPGEAGARTAVRPTERDGSSDGAVGGVRPGLGDAASGVTVAPPERRC